jgi:hypothetical protein
MSIQIQIWERRDGGSRETMGNTALELCRIIRKTKGINSARFYWSGSEEIVFLVEGEDPALGNPEQMTLADFARLGFILADNARVTLNKRLMDPKTGFQNYRMAGR